VGATFTKLVVEAALTDNFAGMKSLYNRACGITAPNEKLWLLDVDAEDAGSRDIEDQLRVRTALIARIPSRRAFHLIVRPLDLRLIGYSMPADGYVLPNVQLHKDNPTNLYIPDEAA
jgi:hypothetical protein